ncbi:MAG TPA: type II secretion system F family protein [Verrucomicrobiae bacterium]|nr:type II secretion system F family protein [Verrucomicrobiae bacterium]
MVTPRQLIHRAQFYRQLGQLTAAGIPIIKALDMLLRNPPARSYSQPIETMVGQLSQGSTIGESLRHLGRWMPSFDIALVEAAEKSGRLDSVFRMLADYYEDRAALMRRVIGDLIYPIFLFHFAVLIFGFVEWFQGGASLMSFALSILKILIPLYVVLFLLVFAMQSRRNEKWRSFLERLLRPVPVLGPARHCMALSRLSAALEALINAGVSIVEGWEMAAAASGSPAIYRAVIAWRPKVNAGQTPSEAVNAARSQFPELFANLYYSGEVSGQLDDSLRRLHLYYQEEGTQKLRLLSLMVPKAIYLCVAGMIAYKIIHFYTGYFNEIKKVIGP